MLSTQVKQQCPQYTDMGHIIHTFAKFLDKPQLSHCKVCFTIFADPCSGTFGPRFNHMAKPEPAFSSAFTNFLAALEGA